MSRLGYFGEEYIESPSIYYNDMQDYKNVEYINPNVRMRDKNFQPMNFRQNIPEQHVQSQHCTYTPQVITNEEYTTMLNCMQQQTPAPQFYNYTNCGIYQKTDSTTWIMKPKKYLRKSTTSILSQDIDPPLATTSTQANPNQGYSNQSSKYYDYYNPSPYSTLPADNGAMYSNFQTSTPPRIHTRVEHNTPLMPQTSARQNRQTTYPSEVNLMQRGRGRNIYNCNCTSYNNGYLDFNKNGQFTGKIFKGYDTTNSRGSFQIYNSDYMRRTSGGHSAEVVDRKNCDIPTTEGDQQKETEDTDVPSGYGFDCSFEPTEYENDPRVIYESYINSKSYRNYNNTVESPRQRFNTGKFYMFKKPSYNCKFNYPSAHRYLKKMLEKTRRFYNLRANKKSKSLLSLKAASPSNCYKNERLRCFEIFNDGCKYVTPTRNSIKESKKLNFSTEELRELEACQWHHGGVDLDIIRPYRSVEYLLIKSNSVCKRCSLPTVIPMQTIFRNNVKPNDLNIPEFVRKESADILMQDHSLVQLTDEGLKSVKYKYNADIVNNININCESPTLPSDNIRNLKYGDIIENSTPIVNPFQRIDPVNVTAPDCLLLITEDTNKQINMNSISGLDANINTNNFMFEPYTANKYSIDYVEEFADNLFGITKSSYPETQYQPNYSTQANFPDKLFTITKPNSIPDDTYRSCYSPEYLQSLKF